MKRHLLFLVLVVLVAISSPCRAAIKDGNDLLDACRDADKAPDEMKTQDQLRRSLMCIGYITGVVDGIEVTTEVNEHASEKPQNLGKWGGLFCLPEDGVKTGQVLRVVIKFLRDHPDALHNPSAEIVVAALDAAFPCKAENEQKPAR